MNRTILLIGLAGEVGGWLTEALDADLEVLELGPESEAEVIGKSLGLVIASDPGHDGQVKALLSRLRLSADRKTLPIIFCIDPAQDTELSRGLLQEGIIDHLLFLPLDRSALIDAAVELGGLKRRVPSGPTALAAGVSALWERFQGSIFERVDALENAGVALLEGDLSPDARRAAEREAHKLAGSAGTFGFPGASRAALGLEAILTGQSPLGPDEVLRFSELTVQLRDEFDAGPVADPPTLAQRENGRTILILDPDPKAAREIVDAAQSRDFEAIAASGPGDVLARISGKRPDVIVLDAALDRNSTSSLSLLQLLSEVDPPIPTIITGSGESIWDRVHASRHGAKAFLQKPVTGETVVAEIERVLQSNGSREFCITAVDDDPQILAALDALLTSDGYDVTTIQDPLAVLTQLSVAKPDLLVLDVDMPHLSGVDLCRVLRADPVWQTLPILFLTSRRDQETVAKIFASGADDYVLKPIIPEELTARISNRLERLRLYRTMAEQDFLTGMPNRRKTTELIHQLLKLAGRHQQPFCLAVLDLDNFKQVNDELGHLAGDRVLQQFSAFLQKTFRSEDVVGRWGGEEFVLGMYGMRREDAVQRLRLALEEFRQQPLEIGDGQSRQVSFSGGVSELGKDGDDLETLYRAADQSLYSAKDAGRSRIRHAGDKEEGEGDSQLDVLIVEDDEALGSLLLHTIQSRGLRAEWLRDGHEALGWLEPSAPTPGARVVLLDVDLPGMDGLALLRRLSMLGVTSSSRVVMLTARANENEVLQALRTGAFDHVAKPFSVPVLMQRLQRALTD